MGGRIVRGLVPAVLAVLVTVGVVGAVVPESPPSTKVLLTITVAPTTASIAAGDTQQFTATGHYSDGSTQDLTSSATWASTLTSVATVSSSGLRHRSEHRDHHHHRHLGAHRGHGGPGRHPDRRRSVDHHARCWAARNGGRDRRHQRTGRPEGQGQVSEWVEMGPAVHNDRVLPGYVRMQRNHPEPKACWCIG